jgi:hypothetical protein
MVRGRRERKAIHRRSRSKVTAVVMMLAITRICRIVSVTNQIQAKTAAASTNSANSTGRLM